MPQFFTQNMSTSLIPELSKNYKLRNYNLCKKRIKQIVIISLLIGVFSTLIITLFMIICLFFSKVNIYNISSYIT